MLRTIAHMNTALALVLMTAAGLACNLQAPAPTSPALAPSPRVIPTTGDVASTATAEVGPMATDTMPPTVAATSTVGPAAVVSVSAVGGRLNIRRGPGPDYNTVGSLRDGQSTLATARNQDGTWVLVNAQNTSKSLGWITLKTKYTTTKGDVQSLPEQTVEPAAPAYVRNCTPHEMVLDPGAITILDRGASPENQVQIFPGDYGVTDWITETELSGLSVFEGTTVDIQQDSSGKSYVCP